MTFQLDTSGCVYRDQAGYEANTMPGDRAKWRWSDLTPFAQGYVEAMFAADLADDDPGVPAGLTAMSLRKGFSDLAPETLARIIADCERFVNSWGHEAVMKPGKRSVYFWAQRQANTFPAFPPLTVSLNDQGKVVFGS